jgi:hypothetical protein
MDETVAAVREEAGLRIAPATERLRPFPRATDVEDRLTHGDDLAVGDPRERRGDLICRDGDHDLVEQRDPLRDASLEDERVSLPESRERRRVDVAEPLRDVSRLSEARLRPVRFSLEQEGQRCQHEQPRVLDALVVSAPEDSAAAGHPALGRCEIASEEELERVPEGRTCRALRLASPQPLTVRRRPRIIALVVSPDHVRGNSKALEILDVQPAGAMSCRQLCERVTP